MDKDSGCWRPGCPVALLAAVGAIFWSTCAWAADPREALLVVEVLKEGSTVSRGRGVVLFHDAEFAYLVASWPARAPDGSGRDFQVSRVGSSRKIDAEQLDNGKFLRMPVDGAPAPLSATAAAVRVGDKVRVLGLKVIYQDGQPGPFSPAESEATVKSLYYDRDGRLGCIAIEGIAPNDLAVVTCGDDSVVGVTAVQAFYPPRSSSDDDRFRDPRGRRDTIPVGYATPVGRLLARRRGAILAARLIPSAGSDEGVQIEYQAQIDDPFRTSPQGEIFFRQAGATGPGAVLRSKLEVVSMEDRKSLSNKSGFQVTHRAILIDPRLPENSDAMEYDVVWRRTFDDQFVAEPPERLRVRFDKNRPEAGGGEDSTTEP